MNAQTYYQQLREALLARRTEQEADEMIAFVQGSAMDSGEFEEDYLNSLGRPEEVALILCGEEEAPFEQKSSKKVTPPPIRPVHLQQDTSTTNHQSADPEPEFREEYISEEDSFQLRELPPLFCEPDFSGIRKIRLDGDHLVAAILTGDHPGLYSTAASGTLEIKRDGDKLKITAPNEGFMHFFKLKTTTIELVLVLPQSSHFEKLSIDAVSGELNLHNLQFDTIHADQVSSNLMVSNCRMDKLKIDTVSGSVFIQNSAANRLRADSVSGSLELRTSLVEDAKISAVSGEILMEADPNLPCRVQSAISRIEAEAPFAAAIHREMVGQTMNYLPVSPVTSRGYCVETVSGTITIQNLKG